MKAIMISIRPQWVAKILNGEKTIEVRKRFPKDYVGWVYIYVTKGKGTVCDCTFYSEGCKFTRFAFSCPFIKGGCNEVFNGKVVARFWCDKVERIKETRRYFSTGYEVIEQYHTETLTNEELQKASCLTNNELDIYLCSVDDYFGIYGYHNNGTAIHITRLVIFDKPKELKEFFVYSHSVAGVGLDGKDKTFEILKPLTKAPQSYCFIKDVL